MPTSNNSTPHLKRKTKIHTSAIGATARIKQLYQDATDKKMDDPAYVPTDAEAIAVAMTLGCQYSIEKAPGDFSIDVNTFSLYWENGRWGITQDLPY